MLCASILSYLILFLLQSALCTPRVDPLVNTNVGLIRGLRADDGDYDMFLGIPYAQVDHENPFGESRPQPNFEGIFEAYDDSAMCPQVHQLNKTILGTVDCLQVNVYVPTSASTSNPVPVLVWIYGGSFKNGYFGKEFYGPKYLIKHDVIVVTLNYRTNAYGFMCLDTPEVPGNQGLKDQLHAIRWVNNNIAAFGGDLNKITLIGESAGGHSVEFQLISKKEKIFNNVIIESGSAEAASVLYEPDRLAAIKLAVYLGFETNDTKAAISFLAKTDSNLVVAAVNDLDINFKPCVENEFEGVESFITSPWVHATIPKVKNVPVIIGFNKNELAGSYYNKDAEYFTESNNIVADTLKRTFNFEDEHLEEMKNVVSHFYFGDEDISESLKLDVINFDSDFTYIHPVQRSIKKYLEAGAGDIYYYMFSYIGSRNKIINTDDDGTNATCCASHADELSYLFDIRNKTAPTARDEVIIERMTTMWTNFAKYSNPTPQTTELLPVKWVPLTKDKYTYMDIGAELSLASRPAHDRMAFWNLFYDTNRQLQKPLT